LKTFNAIISIVRPINCLITFFTITLACLICTNRINYNVILIAAIVGALVNAGGNVINDYFDIEIDKINRPDRPLPSEQIPLKLVLNIYFSFLFLSFIISLRYLNIQAFGIVVISSAILFLYSYKLKSIPLLGNVVVSFFTGLAFIFGSVVVENIYCGIIPAIFAFLISLMRELVKDIEDIEGDMAGGITTFPIKFGIYKTVMLISIVGITLIIFTTIPFVLKIYNLYYFIFVSLFVNTILVITISKLKIDTSRRTLKFASKLLKIGMVLGVISIFIGTKL
jgi:geranylgeranylglycerol-phosphate geranylgeranyltransferase